MNAKAMPPADESGAQEPTATKGDEDGGKHTRLARRTSISSINTRNALIDKAESMFGELGIEAVSLRQIGMEIGSSNKNVVGYHFGSKDELMAAVLERRLPAIESRRAALLAEIEEKGARTVPNLLMCFWTPLYEQTDSSGRHSYAQFLGELLRSDMGNIREVERRRYPLSSRIIEEIFSLCPPVTKNVRRARFNMSIMVVVEALRQGGTSKKPKSFREKIFRDSLRTAEFVLMLPA